MWKGLGCGPPVSWLSRCNTAQAMFHTGFSLRPWYHSVEPAHAFRSVKKYTEGAHVYFFYFQLKILSGQMLFCKNFSKFISTYLKMLFPVPFLIYIFLAVIKSIIFTRKENFELRPTSKSNIKTLTNIKQNLIFINKNNSTVQTVWVRDCLLCRYENGYTKLLVRLTFKFSSPDSEVRCQSRHGWTRGYEVVCTKCMWCFKLNFAL